MYKKPPFLVDNLDQLSELCDYKEQDFKDFLKKGKENLLKSIENEFDNKPNFDARLRKHLKDITSTKNFIIKLPENNDRFDSIVKYYDFTINDLRAKYNSMYPNIFFENYNFNFFNSIKPNSIEEKKLNDAVKKMREKYKVAGNEEYFKHYKLNEVFTNYNSYKIFFDFVELFKTDSIYEFNHADASYLYRKMFEKKYIIDSVSEQDFRKEVYDKMDLIFNSKLKVMSACQSIYKNIIFDYIEKQNRSQRSFLSS